MYTYHPHYLRDWRHRLNHSSRMDLWWSVRCIAVMSMPSVRQGRMHREGRGFFAVHLWMTLQGPWFDDSNIECHFTYLMMSTVLWRLSGLAKSFCLQITDMAGISPMMTVGSQFFPNHLHVFPDFLIISGIFRNSMFFHVFPIISKSSQAFSYLFPTSTDASPRRKNARPWAPASCTCTAWTAWTDAKRSPRSPRRWAAGSCAMPWRRCCCRWGNTKWPRCGLIPSGQPTVNNG